MYSTRIEGLAVNCINTSILNTRMMAPFISENDKEPSWDGHIYVYNNEVLKKNNLYARIPVQVKGKVYKKNQYPKEISFPVEVSDLRNYLHGGCIYFVVYLNDENNTSQIYYITLTPIVLQDYLTNTNNQKKKTIYLKKFPETEAEKRTIFVNFDIESKKQASFVGTLPPNIMDVSELSVSTVHFGSLDGYPHIFSPLLKKDLCLYATINGSPVPHPIKQISIQTILQEEKCKISIRSKEYYNSIQTEFTSDGSIVKIGDSLSMAFIGKDITITYSPQSMLRKEAKDLDFFVALIDAQEMCIHNSIVPLTVNINTSEYKKRLLYIQRIVKLLDVLNIEEDINLDKLTNINLRDIDILVKAFVDKESIINLKYDEPTIIRIEIANLTIMCFIRKDKNETAKYVIEDFFKNQYIMQVTIESGEKVVISPYSILKPEDYLKISNIDYSEFVPSYKTLVKISKDVFTYANQDLLNILRAYDNGENPRLLSLAKDIANWLIQEDTEIDMTMKRLNLLQIVKREQKLTNSNIEELTIFTEDCSASEEVKIAAYLLMDNQIAAKLHFGKLDTVRQNRFKEFPIYKFWSE